MKSSIFLLGLLAAATLPAASIYLNSTNDTSNAFLYSFGPFTELGDQILLGGTDRQAQSATVQFFDNGSDGTFDATLRFFNVGSPVGLQIGGSFTVTGISIVSGDVATVTFPDLGSLVIPDSVIFMVSVGNLSTPDLDLGLSQFNPATLGSSDPAFFITNDGSSFAQTSSGTSTDNFFFTLDATSPVAGVPEPDTGFMAAVGLALAGIGKLAYSWRKASEG